MIDQNKEKITQEQESLILKEKEFFKKTQEPTIGEKIDYIYKTLKKEKRNAKIKLVFRILFWGAILYFIFFYIPSIPQRVVDNFTNQIQTSITDNIGIFIKPIIEDLIKE